MVPVRKVDRSMWLRANFPTSNGSRAKKRAVSGYGINDADYVVSPLVNGVRVPCFAYVTWRGLIQRCKDTAYHEKHKAYQGVEVCPEWRMFSEFRRWWLDNYVEDFELDKDIMSDGVKIYSPETCIFIPKWLNLFIKESNVTSGLPKGVLFEEERGKFKATLKHLNKTINVGRYSTAEEASTARIAAKIEVTIARRWEIDSVSPDLFNRIIEIIKEGR